MMKQTILITCLLLFTFPMVCFTQISLMINAHTHVNNVDSESRTKTREIATEALAQMTMAVTNASTVSRMVTNERELLLKKYETNAYDNRNAALNRNKALTSASLSLGTFVASGALSDGYYMTQNKKDYMNRVSLEKAMLATNLQSLNKDKITSANRQHIYRLRNQLVQEYSANDMEVLKLLFLPAASYAVRNVPDMLLTIKNLEVIK